MQINASINNNFLVHINNSRDLIEKYNSSSLFDKILDIFKRIFGFENTSSKYEKLIKDSINKDFTLSEALQSTKWIKYTKETKNKSLEQKHLENIVQIVSLHSITSNVFKKDTPCQFYKCTKNDNEIYFFGTTHLNYLPHINNRARNVFHSYLDSQTKLFAEVDLSLLPGMEGKIDYELCKDPKTKKIKPILGLETLDDQLPIIQYLADKKTESSFPKELQVAYECVFKSYDFFKGTSNIDWIEDSDKDFVLSNRNVKWVNKLMLDKTQKKACVVGHLHLHGEKGVLNLLKNKGFTVEQIKSSKQK
jgi:hypothetical protein